MGMEIDEVLLQSAPRFRAVGVVECSISSHPVQHPLPHAAVVTILGSGSYASGPVPIGDIGVNLSISQVGLRYSLRPDLLDKMGG